MVVCEPLITAWLPLTAEPYACYEQVSEKSRGEHLKLMYVRICVYVCINVCINVCMYV